MTDPQPSLAAIPRRVPQALAASYLLQPRGIETGSAFALICLAALGYFQLIHPAMASMAVLVLVMAEFVRRMDRGIPLLQITAAIATLQWLIGPTLTYYLGLVHGRYFMYVPDSVYFHYTLPATCAYCVCVLGFGGSLDQRRLLGFVSRDHYFGVGLLLVAVSFASQFAAGFMPSGLAFLFHLCSQVRYVGALYFLFSNHRARYVLAVAACAPLFFASAESGMFHDLILWLAMLSTFWIARRKWNLLPKLLFIMIGGLFVFTIQVIKQDYRVKLDAGKDPSLVGQVIGAISQKRFLEDDVLSLATARLNQGWIISATMLNVPYREPFAGGETIKTAVLAAFMPRLLFENKKGAGGQENFRRFTGLPIQQETSMGISPLGEAYVNYGVEGGIAFMAVFGICFSLLYRFVATKVVRHPDLIFWIPLIFYQGIKAETEMIVVVNQLVKGSVIVLVGYFTIKRIFIPLLSGRDGRSMRFGTVMPALRRYQS